MKKTGLEFELTALDFLDRIFSDLGYDVTRKRNQKAGTQDGYDNLIEIVTSKYKRYTIYAECKDYSSTLHYTQALEKIPHITSTHDNIDLILFISPFKDFSNPNEPNKVQGFYDTISVSCPVQFLTPEYFIADYFRLYPDLFKTVYNEEAEIVLNEKRKELLNKFDKLIFSDKNLRRIVIEEEDKDTYLNAISYTPYYIDRTFRKNPQQEQYYWNASDDTVEFNKLISDCTHGIVVLGNPGAGKTTELKNIAQALWDSRNENNIIPFYYQLKNCTSAATIPDILPKEYIHIPYLLAIFDGLDEVDNIADFGNKLRSFIKTKKTNNILKFIISCRTSIYNKIVKDLDGFTTAYLNPVSEGHAIKFLADKFQIDFTNKHKSFDYWRYRDLLGNPFYLELIGRNYYKRGELEISRARLISQYIDNRLEEDEKDKFRNEIYSSGQHLELAKKLAFALEMMQLSSIEDSKARPIVGDTTVLSKNPFIEQTIDQKWSFELKNVQEYLVAEMLSKMEFKELLLLIKIDDGINKIHPSWHNVVTLLLNIEFEQKETYKQLVDWLIVNDIEMIFQADPELVSDEIRSTAFQNHFQTHCIEKTLWIDNEQTVGRFGDTQSNIKYLLQTALNKNTNLRTRLSAIVLLEHMSIMNEGDSIKVEALMLQVMDEFKINEKEYLQIMAKTLGLIKKTAPEIKKRLLPKVTTFTLVYDYRELVQVALGFIAASNFQEHQEFVLETLKKSLKEKQWSHKSQYGSLVSTKEQIFKIFGQIRDADTLISLLKFFSKRLSNHNLREKYIEQFMKHCATVLPFADRKTKEQLVEIIFDVVTTNKMYHIEERLLASLAKSCSVDEELFIRLLAFEDEKNSNIYFLEHILKEEWYGHIIDCYTIGTLKETFFIQLRNCISYSSAEKAIRFQSYVENNSVFQFSDRIENSTMLEQREFNRNQSQREFDVKFNTELLKTHLENIFRYCDITELVYEDVDRFWDKYYKDFELKKAVSEYAIHFLQNQFNEHIKKIKIEEIEQIIIDNKLSRLEDIYQALPEEDASSPIIKDFQKDLLRKWLSDKRPLVEDYLDNPRELDKNEPEARTLVLFLNFFRYFKFTGFEESFLLKLFVNYINFDFQFLEELVDHEKITNKVLAGLNTNTDFQTRISLLSYLKAKNKIFDPDQLDISGDILDCIRKKNYCYARELIELFYTDDSIFLKMATNLYLEKDEDHYLLPFILNCLIKLGEHKFVKTFISDNFEFLISKKLLEEPKAIEYLVKSNGEYAFKRLDSIIRNITVNAGDTYYNSEYSNFENAESIDDLIEIATYCLSLQNYDDIFNGWFKPMRMVTDALVSICKKNDLATCDEIQKKIAVINPINDKKQNNRFYYESLMNDVKDVVYTHKSIPFSIKETIDISKKYEFLFY